ncbi:MFS transporter [Mycolicibacterium mengxianglii]|uniref:MFS transporter n=1 Tax=Mycolicibacterium mengxianglii TaxID=2736649 RepID=UPI0018D1106E|nr:MFS transporter [Mycolicibacterium mengxianglii]
MASGVTTGTATWRALLGSRYLGTSTVLAGGVGLYATNEFITISLLPSAVADIGGQRLYAWVTTVYLVASVVAATTVNPIVTRLGPRWAYLNAMAVFAAGTVACSLAPTMEMLLLGRTVQGLGGGVLAGLGYAVINAALPPELWTKASALVSAMWGVGTVVGPAAGGLFAQYGMWRWAFGALVIATAVMAVLVPFSLPARERGGVVPFRIPIGSLLLLGTAALSVSVAGIPRHAVLTAVLLAAGVALAGLFLLIDRRAKVAVLPPSTFGPGPLKWIYLTLGLLMASTMVDMYVPLFGQRLAHLVPVVAGFLGVVLSVGWTVGELSSASLRSVAVTVRVVAVAPLVMAVGLGVAAVSQVDDASRWSVAVWSAALLVTGVGIGMAWPHLSAWAMGSVRDPGEGAAAAAAINTVQLICGAFGAGLAGVVVNMSDRGDATAARWMFGVFAVLAVVGVLASYRAGRGRVPSIHPLRSG